MKLAVMKVNSIKLVLFSYDLVIESGEVPFKAASRSNYSSSVTKVLRKWFEKHIDNPYPSEEDRIQIWEETGLTRKQLRVWFINSRKVNFYHLLVRILTLFIEKIKQISKEEDLRKTLMRKGKKATKNHKWGY